MCSLVGWYWSVVQPAVLAHRSARVCAAAGASVVLLGRRVAALELLFDDLVAAGARTPAIFPMDLAGSGPDEHALLATTLERECGRLDAIVHAAAHFSALVPMQETAIEDWARALAVNVTAPLMMTQACIPLLKRNPQAAVVFALDDAERCAHAFWADMGQ
ncbi:MAG: SDR family NAD(P)-dependent oxidoreductase [Rhodobacteraceae bacterium]|nr:SDR family NAD(P)-dependent oxidoreductase [Paracoccaceae bacterium]